MIRRLWIVVSVVWSGASVLALVTKIPPAGLRPDFGLGLFVVWPWLLLAIVPPIARWVATGKL